MTDLQVPTQFAATCEKLTKTYGDKTVLRALDWQLPAGTVIGLVGKNGSGKTTFLKTLLGIIHATSGTVTTLGHDAWDLPANIKEQIGYVPQQITLYPWMKVRQMIAYTASFYRRWNKELIERLLKDWEVPHDVRIGVLSAGQLQKLAILLALGHEPKFLVLDEPAAALDPIARRGFLAALLDVAANQERTILFSTHLTADLERVASHVAVLQSGSIFYFDELSTLKETTKRLHIVADNALPMSLEIPNTLAERVDGTRARVSVAYCTEETIKDLRSQIDASIRVEDLSLDEIFLELHHA